MGQRLTVLEDAVRDGQRKAAPLGRLPLSKERHRPPTTMSMATIHDGSFASIRDIETVATILRLRSILCCLTGRFGGYQA
jgi:hypothetical protein